MLLLYRCSTKDADQPINLTDKMDISTIQNQYTLNVRLFNNVMKDIDDGDANQRMNTNTNSLCWIAGHSLDIQYNLAMLLGLTASNPYAEQFAFGVKFDPNGNYPSIEQMRTDWNQLAPQIQEALSGLAPAQLSAAAPFPIPYPEQSIKGLLAFQMHHLAYEIGQLGLYRRFLGKAAMSYQ